MEREFDPVSPQDPAVVDVGLDLTVEADDVDWDDAELLGLPEGLRVKVVNENGAEGRTDMLVKYPEGYFEPRHTHESAHACLILEGRILVDDRELTAGDYIYGQQVPHGPWEFPDGGMNFVSFIGGSPLHQWDGDA